MPADFYMKMTDVEGESTAKGHEKEIELLSFSSGVAMAVGPRSTSGSPAVERANPSDIVVTKYADKASTKLFYNTCAGSMMKEVIISVNRTDGQGGQVEFLQYKLTDVLITSFMQSGGGGGGLPVESLGLNYGSIIITYMATDPSTAGAQGSLTGGWDFASNEPV